MREEYVQIVHKLVQEIGSGKRRDKITRALRGKYGSMVSEASKDKWSVSVDKAETVRSCFVRLSDNEPRATMVTDY